MDFDGTACSVDVSEVLLEAFGDSRWMAYNDMVMDGSMGLREAAGRQAALLTESETVMLAYAVERCPLDPTFAGFVGWAEGEGVELTIVSDGLSLMSLSLVTRS